MQLLELALWCFRYLPLQYSDLRSDARSQLACSVRVRIIIAGLKPDILTHELFHYFATLPWNEVKSTRSINLWNSFSLIQLSITLICPKDAYHVATPKPSQASVHLFHSYVQESRIPCFPGGKCMSKYCNRSCWFATKSGPGLHGTRNHF